MATTYLNIGTGSTGNAVAGTSTTTIGAIFNLTGDNGQAVDIQLYNAYSPAVLQSLGLSSGANTISTSNCPALAKAGGVILIPPSGNTTSLTLKGVSGDTGIALSLTAPTMLTFATTPPTSFVITTGGAITGFFLAWI